jgi:hypothetical protein
MARRLSIPPNIQTVRWLGATAVGSVPADVRTLREARVDVAVAVATAHWLREPRAGIGDGGADPGGGTATGGLAEDQCCVALVSAIRLGRARPKRQRGAISLEIDVDPVHCGLTVIQVGLVIAAAGRLATVPRFVEADQEIRLAGT